MKSKKRIKIESKLYLMKKRAIKKDVPFEIDFVWLRGKLDKGKCEITGTPFRELSNNTRNGFSMSVDRIDPKKGYTKDNCQAVLTLLNLAKGEDTYEDLYVWAKAFIEKYETI
jgi:hypothetical protein